MVLLPYPLPMCQDYEYVTMPHILNTFTPVNQITIKALNFLPRPSPGVGVPSKDSLPKKRPIYEDKKKKKTPQQPENKEGLYIKQPWFRRDCVCLFLTAFNRKYDSIKMHVCGILRSEPRTHTAKGSLLFGYIPGSNTVFSSMLFLTILIILTWFK